MSLSKQLLSLISALFLAIFGVNFTLSLYNIRDYLQNESVTHAQNTATSLGLALSPHADNLQDPVIATMMSAIFDDGYYQQIQLSDTDRHTLTSLTHNATDTDVPQWFKNCFPIIPAQAESEINNGWQHAAVLTVTVNPQFAYSKLYRQAQTTLTYSIAAFLFSVLILIGLLRITLSSLRRLDNQALSIANGDFTTTAQQPWTTEVNHLATSLHTLSQKMGVTITGLNQRLDAMSQRLSRDESTGLHKKSVFETDMKQLFMDHDGEAFIALIKLDGLANFSKQHDSQAIDDLLREFAQILSSLDEQSSDNSRIKAYRFQGAEFALLIQSCALDELEQTLKSLSSELAGLGSKHDMTDLAHIGVVPFNPLGTTEDILIAAAEAYQQALLISDNSYFIRGGDNFSRSTFEWKALVYFCVDHHAYHVAYIGSIQNPRTGQTWLEEAFLQAHDKNGSLVATGPFISIAEKFIKIVELDKGVVHKVCAHINSHNVQHAVAVNLSTRTIKNVGFRTWLGILLKHQPHLSQRLIFAFSAYAVAKDIVAHQEFFNEIKQLNGQLMIKRFDGQSLAIDSLKSLRPQYVRLTRDMSNGIELSPEKREFAETLHELGSLLDMAVLAENVQSDNDYQLLRNIGFAGASR